MKGERIAGHPHARRMNLNEKPAEAGRKKNQDPPAKSWWQTEEPAEAGSS